MWKKCQCNLKSLFWSLSFTKPVQGGNTVLIFKVTGLFKRCIQFRSLVGPHLSWQWRLQKQKRSLLTGWNGSTWCTVKSAMQLHAFTHTLFGVATCDTKQCPPFLPGRWCAVIPLLTDIFAYQHLLLVDPSFRGVRKGSKVHCFFFKAYSCILWFLWARWSTRGDSRKWLIWWREIIHKNGLI